MLTYDELLREIRRRSPAEQLALLEELAHSLRAELTPTSSAHPEPGSNPANLISKTPEELGWPPGYFESVYGSLRDTNFERPSQGNYELREDLD
jgi:hypothetical protein